MPPVNSVLSSRREPGALFFAGTIFVFLALMTSSDSPGIMGLIQSLGSGQPSAISNQKEIYTWLCDCLVGIFYHIFWSYSIMFYQLLAYCRKKCDFFPMQTIVLFPQPRGLDSRRSPYQETQLLHGKRSWCHGFPWGVLDISRVSWNWALLGWSAESVISLDFPNGENAALNSWSLWGFDAERVQTEVILGDRSESVWGFYVLGVGHLSTMGGKREIDL